ncbi:FAD-dependent monooxygenase [Mycobacterium sp.]|uniref:FAD-dependent monooxygenase n=1 Tax=Mycobacterium sp. TaxID=1785 RepID=UPI002CE7C8EB|nr:FAD-dependent monooxygenase [Mycobacterium sp.]HKP40637.1 FAD-dependent monooxygenase [Mycobacterium sp.]
MNTTRTPVLIVGAGAGGLAMSALLAKHGLGSLLVEKRREVFLYPKARNLSFRTLEVLRGLGLADEIHAIASGVSAMAVKSALNSPDEEVIDFDSVFAEFDALSPEPSVQYCPQSRLEPILLAYTRGRGNEARYGTELVSFEQDEAGVTAVVGDLDSGQEATVRADYLVAADGVHSRIRDMLGITTHGFGALPIYVVFIYFRAPWQKFVAHLGVGAGVQVRNADVDGIFVAAEHDLGMFIMTYLPSRGETAEQFTAQRCRELIGKAVGEHIDVDIIDVAPWRPYERVADRFRCGRVFLVGDAAHAMPPFKAGGANTAIQSADNLAWKLAAHLAGTAGQGLLDTYHAERYPVGRFSARQSLTGPPVSFLRLEGNEPMLPADEEAPMFALLAGYRYHSAAVVPDDAGPADGVALVGELRGQAGTRVPHLWVEHDGTRVSTLDLLGPGFTLLTGDDGAWDSAAASAAKTLGVPITVHRVDEDGAWAGATGLEPDGALLVRPDAFVGWRTSNLPERPDHELVHSLSTILNRA